MLASVVGDIRVYAFDEATGLLAKVMRANREDIDRGWIEVEMPDGVYTIVAWAGSGENLMQGGYLESDMSHAETHTFTPQVTIGVTTLQNFRLMLRTEELQVSSVAEAVPEIERFDHLFFASAQHVQIVSDAVHYTELDFIKNTKKLTVRVTGLDNLTTRAITRNQLLNVFVTGFNERYNYNNDIDTYSRNVLYEPVSQESTSDAMDVDFRVQRIDVNNHLEHPMMLYIQQPSTQKDMVIPLNVIDAILRTKDGQGNLIWSSQEDIDREDEFVFNVSVLHDLSVGVTINGFDLVDAIPEL